MVAIRAGYNFGPGDFVIVRGKKHIIMTIDYGDSEGVVMSCKILTTDNRRFDYTIVERYEKAA